MVASKWRRRRSSMPRFEPPRLRGRTRGPRVALLGRDRPYLAEAARRLRAAGLEVATTSRPSEIADLVKRLEVDVAIVDGSDYLAGIVPSMTGLAGVTVPVAIVTVVEDSLISPVSHEGVMPKWASLSRLHEHVEVAFELRARHSAEAGL